MRYRVLLFTALALGVAGCDQGTKGLAVAHLTDATRGADSLFERARSVLAACHPRPVAPLTVLPDYWQFRYAENPGVAFSLLRDWRSPWRRGLLSLVGVAFLVFLVLQVRQGFELTRLDVLALALVGGGALGNLVDRVRLGYVVDFIRWNVDTLVWPTFNVADAALVTGGLLILLRAATFSRVSPALPS